MASQRLDRALTCSQEAEGHPAKEPGAHGGDRLSASQGFWSSVVRTRLWFSASLTAALPVTSQPRMTSPHLALRVFQGLYFSLQDIFLSPLFQGVEFLGIVWMGQHVCSRMFVSLPSFSLPQIWPRPPCLPVLAPHSGLGYVVFCGSSVSSSQ